MYPGGPNVIIRFTTLQWDNLPVLSDYLKRIGRIPDENTAEMTTISTIFLSGSRGEIASFFFKRKQ